MKADDASIPTRTDLIWRRASVASEYHASRKGIPFADAHFAVMHQLLDAAGITVRNLLDLGAGDGIATTVVAERQPVERAVLVDFSPPMMDLARERFAPPNVGPAAQFVVGDFRASDWHAEVAAAGPYDAVVSRFAIHHIPDEDKRALYGAVLGWLAPGGLFVNIEHVASASDLYHQAHEQLMIHGIMAAQGDEADAEQVAATYRARQDSGANILAPVEVQLAWLRELGFGDVDCAFKAFELAVFAGRRPSS
ncbi:MAG TPA: class I SAM-dependent methyltransferase [Thermomicrobiales bacterium]|nr:class I SAM-dependent methyltransferase [Thermomicrobiales bacterium]